MDFLDNVKIRPEKESEFPEIYELIRTAFKTAQVKDGNEQDFAESLRGSDGYIPELALVAESGGELIGHVMLTRTVLTEGYDGGSHEALLLAPLSVAFEYRNKGVGQELVKEALKRAAAMGFGSVFLVGNPGYYTRCGFEAVWAYGIHPKNDIPETYVLGYQLVPGIFFRISGTLECF